MNKQDRIKEVILYVVYICYLLLLTKILFLSRISLSELFNHRKILNSSINLIPFQSIWEYIFGGSSEMKKFALGNVAGNIIAFIPLGVYLPLFKKDKRGFPALLLIFAVSLSAEIIQGILGIGASDIDDIILNCLGGFAGILGYKLLWMIWQDEKTVRNTITVLSAIGLPVILYLLFMIKMRF